MVMSSMSITLEVHGVYRSAFGASMVLEGVVDAVGLKGKKGDGRR